MKVATIIQSLQSPPTGCLRPIDRRLWAGMFFIALTACQSMPVKPLEPLIEFKTLLQFPMIDPELLTCPREPALPDGITTDAAALAWSEDVRQAGKACRANVNALRELVAKWPKP